jgi:hypothetical protein
LKKFFLSGKIPLFLRNLYFYPLNRVFERFSKTHNLTARPLLVRSQNISIKLQKQDVNNPDLVSNFLTDAFFHRGVAIDNGWIQNPSILHRDGYLGHLRRHSDDCCSTFSENQQRNKKTAATHTIPESPRPAMNSWRC